MNASRTLSAVVAALLAVPLPSPPGAWAQAPAPQPPARPDSHAAPPKPAAAPAPGAAKSKPPATPVVTAPAEPRTHKAAAGAKPPAAAAGGAAKEGAEAPGLPAKPGTPTQSAEPPKGGVTGLPLPRWASLRADEVNMRTGPGTRYPIEWVYRRRDLPVQIEREFEVWRLIADQEGVKGWVHQATLTGRRSFVAAGAERVIRHSADAAAAPVARLQPGVVGRLRSCDPRAVWCEVQVGEYRGFLKRDEIYGIYPGEPVN